MKKVDNNLADIYGNLDLLQRDFRNKNLYNLVFKKIKGPRVLDIGCGAGHLLNLCKERGHEVCGLEPNKKLISLSKKYYPTNLYIFNGGVEQVSKIKGKVDTITMIDVLEHIKDDKKALLSITKKLNTSGKLIIIVPAYQFLYGKRDKNIGHYRRYTRRTLTNLLKSSGFEIIESRYWNMAGVLPYFYYEKILRHEITNTVREKTNIKSVSLLNKFLFSWFKFIENSVNLGFGLSVVCVSQLKD